VRKLTSDEHRGNGTAGECWDVGSPRCDRQPHVQRIGRLTIRKLVEPVRTPRAATANRHLLSVEIMRPGSLDSDPQVGFKVGSFREAGLQAQTF